MIQKFNIYNENIFKPRKIEDRAEILKKTDDAYLESIKDKVMTFYLPSFYKKRINSIGLKKFNDLAIKNKVKVKIFTHAYKFTTINGIPSNIKNFIMDFLELENDDALNKECIEMGFMNWVDRFKTCT